MESGLQAAPDLRADARSWQRVLDRPISGLSCVASWLLSTAIFCGVVALLGGPTQGDAAESLYGTWSVAHGNLACAYPPASPATSSFLLFYRPLPSVPPLWPLLSGAIGAITRVGHRAPFPGRTAMGPGCVHAYGAMYEWSRDSYALFATLGLGYAGWFVLLAGCIAVIRASGRGRTGWEAAGVPLVALAPSAWATLLIFYHPQDLVAVGLLLASVACVQRGSWLWAGVLLGLALTTQQFALLVLAPLFVLATGRQRWQLLGAAAAAAALVSLPFLIATSGRAVHSEVLGTGDSATYGGAVVWELGLHGAAVIFVSRFVPILVAIALAWWARHRLGSHVFAPVPLLSLIATCLSLRLVFEEGLFAYKFMALSVLLVLLAVAQRRIRLRLIGWLVLVGLAFSPIPTGYAINARTWGLHLASVLPLACIAVGLALIVWYAIRRRVQPLLVAWVALAVWAFVQWPLWSPDSLRAPFPKWFWQVILLASGVAMAAAPLFRASPAASGPSTDPAQPAVGAPDPLPVPN